MPRFYILQEIRKINALISRIGVFHAVQHAVLVLAIRGFGKYIIPSYSQFGEDRMIEYFTACSSGTYVDVGANHPVLYSNTYKLYLKGWKGLCIDANKALIALHRRLRPQDESVEAVVSTSLTPVDFYFHRNSNLISGIGSAGGNWPRTTNNCTVKQIVPRTLSSILEEFNIMPGFDLLSIDVEGNELDVLISLQLDVYRPRLVLIEIHEFDLATPCSNNIYSYLYSNGYVLRGYAQPSALFLLEFSEMP